MTSDGAKKRLEAVFELEDFKTSEGREFYREWYEGLRDKKVMTAVDRRLNHVKLGNFGDHRFCRDGVWELRIDLGPGYRIYYALSGVTVVLLFCGGDKRTQSSDIDRACRFWNIYQGEKNAKR